MENKTQKEILQMIGNGLQGMDEAIEKNGYGFNKIDKGYWECVSNVTSMKLMLKKYKRQIEENWGAETYEAAGLNEVIVSKATLFASYNKYNQIEALLEIEGKFKNFNEYVAIHKGFGFRGNKKPNGEFVWCVNREKVAWSEYEAELKEIGVTFMGLPPIPEKKLKVINPEKTVFLTRKENGLFSFKFGFSRELNNLFSNGKGNITGIVECNTSDWSRNTYSLELVEEILEKIPQFVTGWSIEIGPEIEEARKEFIAQQKLNETPIPEVAALLAEGITLKPYQNEGVRFFNTSNGNAILGDEMGLGKTPQCLAYLVMNNKTALCVVPKVVRRNWCNEAMKFFPTYYKNSTLEVTAKNIKKLTVEELKKYKLISTNYETFKKLIVMLEVGTVDAIVIDESHRIKNPKAQITQAVIENSEKFQHRILLSGTAVKNKKKELYTQINYVAPNLFSSAEEIHMGTYGGVWNKMRGVYLARQKSKVLKELPPKTRTIVELEVKGMPVMPEKLGIEQISKFKAQASIAKVPKTVEFIEELLKSSESCILVFSDSKEAAVKIAEKLGKKALLHHGQMSDEKREEVKELFQSGKSKERVFVTTRQSMAVGATMTRADKVVFNCLPWTPADVRQAEDRCHRIGAVNPVNVYWITAENSEWDMKLVKIIENKFTITKKINEGSQVTAEEMEFMNSPVNMLEVFSAK